MNRAKILDALWKVHLRGICPTDFAEYNVLVHEGKYPSGKPSPWHSPILGEILTRLFILPLILYILKYSYKLYISFSSYRVLHSINKGML